MRTGLPRDRGDDGDRDAARCQGDAGGRARGSPADHDDVNGVVHPGVRISDGLSWKSGIAVGLDQDGLATMLRWHNEA